MRFLFLICLLLSSSLWASNTLTSTIYGLDIDTQGDDHFIMLASGEVVFVDDIQMIHDLAYADSDKKIEFSFDQNKQLVYWRSVTEDADLPETFFDEARPTTSPRYTPSVLKGNFPKLATIFSTLRLDSKRRSECFHRAYIWAFEENKRSGRMLTKHFLFFTRKYIREVRYKWWFHVAPSILFEHEEGNGSQQFMILDPKFAKRALTLKEWTDSFISSKRSCPIVYTYSHYANHQESEHCYLIPTPMYYLQPLDIENFEKTGIEKTHFLPGDLNISYRRGFNGSPL